MIAVIIVPAFRLQAVLRLEEQSGAACLVEEGQGAQRSPLVTALNPAAEAAGIRRGMSPTQAVARCAGVALRSRSIEAEATAQRAIQAVCRSVSPVYELTAAGVLTVDLSGVTDLNAGALGRQWIEQLAGLGLVARVGVAGDADLAWFAARSCQRAPWVMVVHERAHFLASVPLAAAVEDLALLSTLQRWGLQTLGEFTSLPIEAVTDRLGEAGRYLWERACGRQRRLLVVESAAPQYEEEIELEYAVATAEPLLFILKRFIDSLCAQLIVDHQAAGALAVTLGTEGDTVWSRRFALPEPTCEPEILIRVVENGLEDAETEYAVTRVSLRMDPVDPCTRQRELFEAAVRNPWRFAETVDRLSALLGVGAVGSPRLRDTHQPDALSLTALSPHVQAIDPGAWERSEQMRSGLPMQRMRPAVVADVHTRGGYPVYVRSGCVTGTVIESRGPWRLSGSWWEPRLQWSTEEWDVQVQGAGLYRLARRAKGWQVEGIYG